MMLAPVLHQTQALMGHHAGLLPWPPLSNNMIVTPPVIIKSSSAMRISSPLAQTLTRLPLQMMKAMMMTMMTSLRRTTTPCW
uniref:Alternative protein C12orf51 n=1 Tax=Homo sapiens TaxID=9606 RepID=L8E8N0_HUMAN|nr:alternative protein C12orf51 [Homo sapiens]